MISQKNHINEISLLLMTKRVAQEDDFLRKYEFFDFID